jgi:hypothetical protein
MEKAGTAYSSLSTQGVDSFTEAHGSLLDPARSGSSNGGVIWRGGYQRHHRSPFSLMDPRV